MLEAFFVFWVYLEAFVEGDCYVVNLVDNLGLDCVGYEGIIFFYGNAEIINRKLKLTYRGWGQIAPESSVDCVAIDTAVRLFHDDIARDIT